jgi:hypothetical protein
VGTDETRTPGDEDVTGFAHWKTMSQEYGMSGESQSARNSSGAS